MKIALQMFSLNNLCAEDFVGTLKKVAKMGFEGVEFAGYFGLSADELKKIIDELGLIAAGTHVGLEELRNNLDGVIDYCKKINVESAVCPWCKYDTREEWISLAKELDIIGKKFKDNDIKFGYHNHNHEFEIYDGEYAMDILLNNSKSDHLFFEPDTYWIKRAGLVPEDYIAKYKWRCPVIHAKDISEDLSINPPSGEGCIDFNAVIRAAGDVDWLVVEQEFYINDPIEDVEIGFKNMSKIGK